LGLLPLGPDNLTANALSELVDWPVAGLFIFGGAAGGWTCLKGAGALVGHARLARRLYAAYVASQAFGL
jgi:hypothetical protein